MFYWARENRFYVERFVTQNIFVRGDRFVTKNRFVTWDRFVTKNRFVTWDRYQHVMDL